MQKTIILVVLCGYYFVCLLLTWMNINTTFLWRKTLTLLPRIFHVGHTRPKLLFTNLMKVPLFQILPRLLQLIPVKKGVGIGFVRISLKYIRIRFSRITPKSSRSIVRMMLSISDHQESVFGRKKVRVLRILLTIIDTSQGMAILPNTIPPLPLRIRLDPIALLLSLALLL